MWKLALLAITLCLSSTGNCEEKESFWCVQFFNKSVPHPLHMEIEETTPVGTVIRRFEVPKEDNLRIVLDEGDTQYLKYDNKKQVLLVNEVLKTRLNSVLELKGVCTHNVTSYNYLFNLTVTFYVRVIEFSDPPQFLNLPTVHEVPEKTKIDEVIFQVKGEDSFDVNRSNITYKLLSISANDTRVRVDHMFTVDSKGNVYLKDKLDYDKGLRFFYLEVEIEDADNPPQRNTSKLTIKVVDNDDQPPRFDDAEYQISLIGEKPVKTGECHYVSPRMKAEDLDPVRKSAIKYRIISGTPTNWIDYFRLQEDNGTLCQLKTLEMIQGRSRSSEFISFPTYVLNVEAYQVDNPTRKHTAKLTIKINNQNIHAPIFSQKLYRANINEYPDLKRGEKVIQVIATDDDYGTNKQFQYEIIQNYRNGFFIDRKTGEIFVSNPTVVDRENKDKIELKVRAVETLSDEKKESDPHARVILSVMDVNDNTPKFTKNVYNFQIKDSLGFHELVHPKDENLEATDPDLGKNGTVVYTITRVSRRDGSTSFDDISRFKMDDQGNLRVGQNLRDLRRKGIFPEYRVTVKAEDQVDDDSLRRSSTAEVYIKVLEANDYPPVFQHKHLSVSVSEATATGSRVAKLEAKDKDGDEDLYLMYRITGGNEGNRFSISKSGYLSTARVLDREAKRRYTLMVQVSDGIHNANAIVEVSVNDVNDHAPEFIRSTFEFSLMENATDGEIFGRVTAVDRDTGVNGHITYSLFGKGAEHFGIKPNGDIYVSRISNLMDKEQNDNIILQVKAVDAGQPPSQDVAGISIEIVDVNDNAPVFSQSIYKGHIDEGQGGVSKKKQVQLEHKIEAIDADKTQENRNVRYNLIGPGNEKFSLHPVTGILHVNNPGSIDCEIKCEYQLKIIARDRNGKGLEGQADLSVTINDINDNAPKFEEDYVINIEPWTTVGTKIQTIKATDNDKTEENNRIMYLLRAGGVGKFQLDFDTGEITVIDKLSREPQKAQYNLNILAIDFGYPSLSSNTTVKINVPVNKPVTVALTNTFHVSEGVSIGTVVGTVNASDPDISPGNGRSLSYALSDSTVPFRIGNKTGIIETAAELDAELASTYEFEVHVLDSDLPPTTATTRVTIVVEDVNDNPPVLSSKVYKTTVSEGRANRKPWILHLNPPLLAEDKDKNLVNRHIRFFLKGKNSDLFRLNPRGGILKIKDTSKLDSEKQHKYKLSIVAFDGTFQSQANLIVEVEDINDNRPIFSGPYFYQVNPRSSIGTKVGKVVATDADATSRNNRILYVLVHGSAGKFGVDFMSGDLYVASNLTDSPQQEEYNLLIQGFDTGEPSLTGNTTVRIRVALNKAPVIDSNFVFQVPENMTIGSTVGMIPVFDPDTKHNPLESIKFSISDPTNNFAINENDGRILTKSVLDRESQEQFIFTVYCENDGAPSHTVSTTVNVILEDVNDNEPIFKSATGYYGTYMEGDPMGIITLNQELIATDADVTVENQNIVYHLVGDDSDLFRLNTAEGTIKVKSHSNIRCNYKDNYKLKVIATDQGGKGHKSESTINVDVQDINDNAPRFIENYYFRVPITAKEGTVIGSVVAIDNDCSQQNNRITYLLKDGGFGKFKIDPEKGEIIIASSLVREPMKNEYSIVVKAVDNGAPGLSNSTNVTITVPVNHPPSVQKSFYFQITEGSKIGQYIGKLRADDKDLGRVKGEKLGFTLVDKTVPFSVHPLSGEIRTNNNIDREETELFKFLVMVNDNGIPAYTATTSVIITIRDLNDNAPHFNHGLEYRGTVVEDDRIPILKQNVELSKNLTVIDRDATNKNRQIKFSLKGPRSRLFKIDSNTGTIYVDRPGRIDREINREFKLKIVATDRNGQGLSTEANLIVEVKDVNDHDPRFVQALYEFVLPSIVKTGYEVGRLIAIDRDDTSPNNKLLYIFESDALGKFKIDVATGVLTLLEGFFSKPRKTTYTFTVAAMDMGFPSRKTKAQVIVNAPHMVYNDHAPKFEGRNVFILKEELPIGSLVGTLQVTDEDKKKNNSVNLIIDPADEKYVPFAIKNDGSIITTKRIDRDAGYEYFRFTVHATDSGAPPHNTSQEVGIIVDDINDNPPHFTMDTYQHMISSSFPASTIIATPFAFDDVDKTDSVYQYRLVGGTPGYFIIDQQTGVIRTTDRARSLKPGKMEFKVVANDFYSKTLKAEAKLNIQVIQSKQGRKVGCCRVPC